MYPTVRRFLIEPNIVEAFLTQPYNLREAWQMVADAPNLELPPGESHYKAHEKALIRAEAVRLYDEQISGNVEPGLAVRKAFKLSAGAPGAGKTKLFEALLRDEPPLRGFLFVDPDEGALKLMDVYHRDIQKFGGGSVGLALSYTKWRGASNYLSNTMMNRGCDEGRSILLSTTATGPMVAALYTNANKAGYESETLIVCAPEDVRYESVRRRWEEEGTRFTNDAALKGELFYARLPTVMRLTDDFRLYWRGQVEGPPVMAASGKNGKITTHDKNALRAIDSDSAKSKPGLSWAVLKAAYQTRQPSI
jgi:predicted ABC-type ATPase